jgi:hypothetical protein
MANRVLSDVNKADVTILQRILRDLEPDTRQQLLAECLASALAALPTSEQKAIRAMQGALAGRIRNLGDKRALEILGAVGRLWSAHHQEL